MECLRDLAPIPSSTPVTLKHDDFPAVLELLIPLKPMIAGNHALASQINLSHAMMVFTSTRFCPWEKPRYLPWMAGKYAATVIYYLDHGAFYHDDDTTFALAFFAMICDMARFEFNLWDEEEKDWKFTVERALFYRRQLESNA